MKGQPGQPRSPRQTQAWPGAWEGARLSPGENTLIKGPPREGDPGLIPSCPAPSLPTPLRLAGARDGSGGGAGIQGPLSSARPPVHPFICTPYLFLAAPHFMNGLRKPRSLVQGHPAASWQSWDLSSELNLNSFTGVSLKFAEPLSARALQPSPFLPATLGHMGKLRPRCRR